ncbi:MAG: hypothetical protein FWG05_04440, partial [Kiritimatiellaeota bacterium]|nr:hypothetical protein [Kiritimatiellota bacterium]
MKKQGIITLAAFVAAFSVVPLVFAQAPNPAIVPFTGDADCGIELWRRYTHTVNLAGDNTSVNGVYFMERYNAGGGTSLQGYRFDNAGYANYNAGNNNIGISNTEEIYQLLISAKPYPWDVGVNGLTFTLSDLTPGRAYDFRTYERS